MTDEEETAMKAELEAIHFSTDAINSKSINAMNDTTKPSEYLGYWGEKYKMIY